MTSDPNINFRPKSYFGPQELPQHLIAKVKGNVVKEQLGAFEAQYQLQTFRHHCTALWERIDFMLLPTAPTHPTIASVEAEPILRNQELGTYTNFVNLMNLCAIAAPAGFETRAGLPFGMSLIGWDIDDWKMTPSAFRVERN
mgnify:CR=1 FL=1